MVMSESEKGGGGSEAQREAAVLLLGHGSHRSAESSLPVRAAASKLRDDGGFREVRTAFWKEDAHLHHALHTVERPWVYAVPVFTSTGYFTHRIVPRELRASADSLEGYPFRLRILPPVGTRPEMLDLALDRAGDTAARAERREGEGSATDVIVVGHGTRRHPDSGRITRELTRRLDSRWSRGRVTSAFLDEDPSVETALRTLSARRVVILPFFVSRGWHAGTTLPGDLGVEGGRTRFEDRELWYAEPVGTHPELWTVISAMVREAMAGDATAGQVPVENITAGELSTPAARAREDFLRWLARPPAAGRTFLEVRVAPLPDGGFELRHERDGTLDAGVLETRPDPEWAREVAARTDTGAHRPLKTTRDLRRGWRLAPISAQGVWDALGHLYPAAGTHWHLARTGSLSIRTYAEAAGRQTGMFAPVSSLSTEGTATAHRRCCVGRSCLRGVLWPPVGGGAPPPNGTPAADGAGGAVPCPEPCSLLFNAAFEEVRRGSSGQGSSQ